MFNKRLISLTLCWMLVIVPGLCVLSFADIESGSNSDTEQRYEKANELYKLADYDAAITEFKAIISQSPNSLIAFNAQYWIGQIYFELRQFDAALSTFQKLIDEIPASILTPTTKIVTTTSAVLISWKQKNSRPCHLCPRKLCRAKMASSRLPATSPLRASPRKLRLIASSTVSLMIHGATPRAVLRPKRKSTVRISTSSGVRALMGEAW